MKHILKFLLLISFLASANASLLEGCYKTVSVDFKRPIPGPIMWRNQSLYEENDNSFTYKTLEGKYMNLEMLTLFTGYIEQRQSYGYLPIVMFKNVGQKIENSFSYYYEVNEELLMKDGARYRLVDHFVNLNILRFGKKLVGSYLFISKERGINEFHDFILEKETCRN